MHSKGIKKIAVVLMSFLMIVVFMPAMAFADSTNPSGSTTGFLSNFQLATDWSGKDLPELSPAFNSETHNYTVKVMDSGDYYRATATLSDAGDGATITAKWKDASSGEEKTKSLTSNEGEYLSGFRNSRGTGNNKLTIEVVKDGVTQDYTFTTTVVRTLSDLKLESGGDTLKYTPSFSSKVTDYSTTVVDSTDSVKVLPTASGTSNYSVKVNGKTVTSEGTQVKLGDAEEQKISVSVSNTENDNSIPTKYYITVKKVEAVKLTVKTAPTDANVYIEDSDNKKVEADSNGVYQLIPNVDYSYTVTENGYVGQSGTLNLNTDTTKEFDLVKATENTSIDKNTSSAWSNFRGNSTNMAIGDYKTPTSKATTKFRWAKKYGSGWGNAPSVQIIVDGKIVTMINDELCMLDPNTGEIVKKGQMAGPSNWGYTPPTYADGMIFCPLSDGTIQAFNAKTLESLWIYTDPLGGQSLSPITYSDGYIYTGFWNSEDDDANYVCLSVTDEDPTKTDEAKTATWRHMETGGYYWAGSVVVGNSVIFGTDDGQSGNTSPTSKLLSVDKKTGKVISKLDLIGDQRSTIAYDKSSGRVYGTTKAGYLFSAAVDSSTGKLSDLKSKSYGDGCMSTSTPVIYKGVAYIGYVEGGNFGGNNYMLAADANTLEENWRVPLKGYPQSSALLSTAYEKTDGNIYLYTTYNAQPGGITMIKAKPDCKNSKDVDVEEIYDAKGYEQYCITSLIADDSGNIYYKNDSCNVMSVGTCNAYMSDIKLTGGSPSMDQDFSSSNTSYDVAVDSGTSSVILSNIKASDGSTVTVNGKDVSDGTATVELSEGKATAEVKVTNGDDTKTYTFNIREKSSDATLSYLNVNETNGYSSFMTMDPVFDASKENYAVYGAASGRNFENLWADANDKNATVKVYALSGVNKDSYDSDEYDSKTGELAVTSSGSGHSRYAIYFGDSGTATVKVVVTSEAGTTKSYRVVISKKASAADALTDVKTEAGKIVAAYDTDDYRTAEKKQLASALKTYNDSIGTAAAPSDVAKVLDTFQGTASTLKTDAEYTAELKATRDSALNDINKTATAVKHDADEQSLIDSIVESARIQISVMTDSDDIQSIVTKAKMDIEYKVMLNGAKADAIQKVKTAAASNTYRDAEQKDIDIIVNDAVSVIKEAQSSDNLNAIVEKAKLDISRIKTADQPTSEELDAARAKGQKAVKELMMLDFGSADKVKAISIVIEATAEMNKSDSLTEILKITEKAETEFSALKMVSPDVVAKATGKNSIELKWNSITGADGYIVAYKKHGTSAWSEMKTSATSFDFGKLSQTTAYDFSVTAYKNAETATVKSEASLVSGAKTVQDPAKVTGLKIKSGKSKLTVSWKKVSGASGYQISYKKASSKKYAVINVGNSTLKKAIKKSKKIKYTIKVRAYVNVNGKKVYGSWSKTYKIK